MFPLLVIKKTYALRKRVLTLFFALVLLACNNGVSQNKTIGKTIKYQIDQPYQITSLPKKLNEISGIATTSQNSILCVQDEEGVLFEWSLPDKKIIQEIYFHKNGDYEALALAEQEVYVLRSDGALFAFLYNESKSSDAVKKYTTHLSKEHDTESVCFDVENNRLLIAVKENPEKIEAWKNHIPVFEFNLNTFNMPSAPAFLISSEAVNKILLERLKESNSSEFEKIMSGKKFDLKFKISDMTIHPMNKHIFAIASVGKLLLELEMDGTIIDAVRLNKKLFPRPEGITFLPDGTLVISNEAEVESANLLFFKMTHE